MNLMDLKNVNRQKLDSEEKCIGVLERMRWPDGVHCPACGSTKISRIRSKGKLGKVRHLYQCLEKTCRYQFSATTGTIFHDSHLPLQKWFTAVSLIYQSEDGISVNQLRFALGVQYKTAKNVAHRIREAMQKGTIVVHSERRITPEAGAVSLPENMPGPALPHRRASVTRRFPSNRPITVSIASAGQAAIGNVLTMVTSLAHFTARSPFIFANYIINKVSLGT